MIGGASFTVFGSRVEVHGRFTLTTSIRSGESVVRAADLVGSSRECVLRADTCEESAVKYHTFGAAWKVSNLHVR